MDGNARPLPVPQRYPPAPDNAWFAHRLAAGPELDRDFVRAWCAAVLRVARYKRLWRQFGDNVLRGFRVLLARQT
jgi:hypothetical protein